MNKQQEEENEAKEKLKKLAEERENERIQKDIEEEEK